MLFIRGMPSRVLLSNLYQKSSHQGYAYEILSYVMCCKHAVLQYKIVQNPRDNAKILVKILNENIGFNKVMEEQSTRFIHTIY